MRRRSLSVALAFAVLSFVTIDLVLPGVLEPVMVTAAFVAAFVVPSWLLPRRFGFPGIIAAHLLVGTGWFMLAGIALVAGSDWYDGALSFIGPVIETFVFNVVLLPVTITAACQHRVIGNARALNNLQ